jgi:ribosome-dependent ATPase
VENLKFAVLDQDKTQLSRNYIENIAGSRYFLEKGTLNSFEELDDRMKSGEISLAFVIPPNFGKNLTKGYKEEIAVWIDGTFPFRAETIHGYVQGLHYNYLQNFYKENLGIDIKSDTNILLRYRYNQDFKSIYSIVPAVIPMLLIFIPAILMALSVVREKELGSITNFYATPVTKLEFLLGKQLPYVIISMISFFILAINFQKSLLESGSTPVVGSSKIKSSGSCIKAQQSPNFCFIPPESFPAGLSLN